MLASTSNIILLLYHQAEGTQSYFDVNAYSATPNGIHNHVNTRAKLQTYDPNLFNLVREVFPCGNSYINRCSSSRGMLASVL